MQTLPGIEPANQNSGNGRKAPSAVRLAGVVSCLLLGAVEAFGDMAPVPRRGGGGYSAAGSTPVILLLAGAAGTMILLVAVRALLRRVRGAQVPADAPGRTCLSSERPTIASPGTTRFSGLPSSAGAPKREGRRRFVATFIVIAIGLGLLAALAVSNFLKFRLKPRASEQKSNLMAIRSTEVAYFAEWNVYVGNQSPTPPIDPRTSGRPRQWASGTRFSILGFAPEGSVYCSYALDGPDFPTDGISIRAECDYDGDGKLSIWTLTSTGNEFVHSGDDF